MIIFPGTLVASFVKRNLNLRWGQEFHQFAKLEKITNPNDKMVCDILYNSSDEVAKEVVKDNTDWNN